MRHVLCELDLKLGVDGEYLAGLCFQIFDQFAVEFDLLCLHVGLLCDVSSGEEKYEAVAIEHFGLFQHLDYKGRMVFYVELL